MFEVLRLSLLSEVNLTVWVYGLYFLMLVASSISWFDLRGMDVESGSLFIKESLRILYESKVLSARDISVAFLIGARIEENTKSSDWSPHTVRSDPFCE